MTRKIRGLVLLAACVGLWSCSSDPTADQAGVPDKIVSLPSVIFINTGDSTQIAFQLVDALDGQIPSEWTITNTSTLFQVTVDTTFRPIYNPDGVLVIPAQPTEVRAQITGLTAGKDSFLVAASGKTLYIPVQVVPNLLDATFSTLAPAFGDTVTITAPSGTLFTDSSVVTFAGATNPIVTEHAVDNTYIKMLVAPNTNAPATVTKVTLTGSPTLRFTLNTTDTLVSPVLANVPATMTGNVNALAGAQVVITLNPAYAAQATSVVSWGAKPAITISVTGGGTVLTVVPQPGSSGSPTITKVAAAAAPQFQLTLPASVPTGLTMSAASSYVSSSPAAAAPPVTAPGFYDVTPMTSACAATGNGGGAGCQYYKFVAAAAGAHVFTMTWSNTDDLGLYFMDSAFNGVLGGGCDAKGNGAAGQPETCTINFPAAGTYYLEIADYGPFYAPAIPPPAWVKVLFN
jgi:hypothetical protein